MAAGSTDSGLVAAGRMPISKGGGGSGGGGGCRGGGRCRRMSPVCGSVVERGDPKKSAAKDRRTEDSIEFPVFSPAANTQEAEPERAQPRRRDWAVHSATGASHRSPASTTTWGAAHGFLFDLGHPYSSQPVTSETNNGTDNGTDNVTKKLLEALISEVALMRTTLENLATDGRVLAEIQTTNKLLALMLTSGHELESYEDPRDYPSLVARIKRKAKPSEVILGHI